MSPKRMHKQQTDHLFQLIKSLSKAEKRNFTLYVQRNSSSQEAKFLHVFEILDKQTEYDEEALLRKAESVKPEQLSNLKAHLYRQLLVSLRLLSINHDPDISIREQIDHARVLYNKGLYKQSLRMLDKAKGIAVKMERNALNLEIIEFEKLIELQYITHSISTRAEELTLESRKLTSIIENASKNSNLALRLYGLYLKVGHVRNERDLNMLDEFFSSNLVEIDASKASFHEKLNYYQSFVWYNYIVQDFLKFYRYSLKWVELFHDNEELIHVNTDIYLKGMNNLMAAQFMTGQYRKLCNALSLLQELKKNEKLRLNDNTSMLLGLFYYMNTINRHFMEGRFSDGLKLVPEIEAFLEDYSRNMDNHRILVFYYKIACLYFGSGDFKTTIQYLNKIINYKDISLREDIHCFARILNLICFYELDDHDYLDSQVMSTYRFLAKMKDLHKVQKYILQFVRNLSYIDQAELKSKFAVLLDQLNKLSDDPFEKRPFHYLDIISWLESKVEGKHIQDIIRAKFLERNHER